MFIWNLLRLIRKYLFFIYSACISAVILSSETLNEEPTASSTQENVLQKPSVAPDIDKSEEFIESRTESEKINNGNLENHRKTQENHKKTQESEQIPHIEKHVPRSDTQLPHPKTVDNGDNEVIPREQSSGERNSENIVYVLREKFII